MQEKRDSGLEVYRKGEIWDWRDLKLEGNRKRGKQQTEYRKRGIQDRRDT